MLGRSPRTTWLDALPYENVDLPALHPYGTPPGR